MPEITSARVEILTAEVRALMVGSRQVTLSVYRQLDWIAWDLVEPMGRINDTKDAEPAWLQIIGRHRSTGALVRAFKRPPVFPSPREVSEEAEEAMVEVRSSWQRLHSWPSYSALPADLLEKSAFAIAQQEALAEDRLIQQRCNAAAQAVNVSIAAENAVMRQEWRDLKTWHAALPLIILAGLR